MSPNPNRFNIITKLFFGVSFLLFSFTLFSQEDIYIAYSLTEELKKDANASIRLHDIQIELHDYSSMTLKSKRVITVFNKNGLEQLDNYVHYDPQRKVKSINAIVYNAFGKEIDKFKKKDFDDYSVSGGDLYTDNRVLALDYTPIEYPFTFSLEVEVYSTSTAFLPRWYPIENYFISTEKASFKLINPTAIELDIKEFNLEIEGVKNLSTENTLHYEANNLPAIEWEALSPAFKKVAPVVMIAPQKFKLVNVDGVAKTWENFGKWNYHNLIKNRDHISEATIAEVTELVRNLNTPVEKAKRIYKYVQDKTRYISIQLGVGGWQPMLASEVDEVSYGDCKALTNYTMSLLQSQGIESYYTVLYGDSDIRDIDKDFVGMQGNHVILNVPSEGEDIWLECTSQKVPFGHIAGFTDDRDVLVITPEGGKIKHTRVYASNDNYLKSKASIKFDEKGGFQASYNSLAGGTRYDNKLDVLESDAKDRDVYYKEYWNYLNDLTVEDIDLNNDRDKVEISEEVKVSIPMYAVIAGDKMLIKPNVFKRSSYLPPRYSERKLPFIIQRGYLNEDNFELEIPEDYKIEALPEPKEINTKFGVYKMSLEKVNDSKLAYKRSLVIFKGEYKKEEYKDYRSFRRKIVKADKTSFVINKNN